MRQYLVSMDGPDFDIIRTSEGSEKTRMIPGKRRFNHKHVNNIFKKITRPSK